MACEPGWQVNNGCLLFKGDPSECIPERNYCWRYHWKVIVKVVTVTQALTVQTSATAAQAEAAVAKALGDERIAPVTTTSTPGRRLQQQDRRLQNTWVVQWTYKGPADSTLADFMYSTAKTLSTDPTTSQRFTNGCKAALPEGSTFSVIQFGEPQMTKESDTTTAPDGGLTTTGKPT